MTFHHTTGQRCLLCLICCLPLPLLADEPPQVKSLPRRIGAGHARSTTQPKSVPDCCGSRSTPISGPTHAPDTPIQRSLMNSSS